LEIDIAVDLGGLSGAAAQPAIFALRSAPIQVNYIGYPGTLGSDFMDYIIADSTLIPKTHQKYYSEKVAYLPSFQVNDTKRVISDTKFDRKELGLPLKGFVFCCFNNISKITPYNFYLWMQILKQVDSSVIWLLGENDIAKENLKKEAEARGVHGNRLVFADRLPYPDHLARYRVADLFLDTLPFNAGTTASDALWAGLPVLTQIGEPFAGRMAASLLNAIGLPELITSTKEDYEALAVELAKNPDKLAKIKQKLAENRLTTSLFDIDYFTKNIESAYIQMYERSQSGLDPDHIHTM
jgi:predicted O-linked N-acetylglucosamine transferase (SPINDLY family)